MKIIERQAFFIDNNGNEQSAIVRINDGVFVGIDTFNKNNEQTGYARFYFQPNNRFFLDVIYCYDKFRETGVATFISELADYVLGSYPGYVIKGIYKPEQLSTDRDNNIERSKQELDITARKFYAKVGYEVVEYEEYLGDKDKYPYLTSEDFSFGEIDATTIIAKAIIPRKYAFYEDKDIIYHVNCDKIKERTL